MIHDDSCECSVDGTDLFTRPNTQTAILSETRVDHPPVGAPTEELGPQEFFIPASDEHYLKLKEHALYMRLKVTKKDGTALEDTDKVAPVNFLLHSLFSQIDIHVNEHLITSTSNTYGYKAYLEKQLNFDNKVKETQFVGDFYAKDTAKQFDTIGDANDGFKVRNGKVAKSKIFEVKGMLHLDFFRQDRLLLNQCSLRIKLTPNPTSFFLMSETDDYKVKILSSRFEIVRVKVNPKLLIEHSKLLATKSARYPIRRSEIKSFSIATGNMQTVVESLFSGQVPRRIIVGLLNTAAFGGEAKKNPYNFGHFNLSSISAYVDGVRTPTRPIEPNYTDGLYIEAYQAMFIETGIMNTERSLDITYDEFANGNALYVIQVAPGDPDSSDFELYRNGSVRLELKFKSALTTTVTALAYAEFDNTIEIDRFRNVVKDY